MSVLIQLFYFDLKINHHHDLHEFLTLKNIAKLRFLFGLLHTHHYISLYIVYIVFRKILL